ADEILGRDVLSFAPREIHAQLRVRRKKVLELGVSSPIIEIPLQRPGKPSLLVESQAVPFIYARQPAILNLLRDVTQRKRAEVDRIEAALREKKAREEFTHLLIASQEAERQRIAGELHDSLGQNLSIIKNRARLASQVSLVPSAAEHLHAIERIASAAI